MSRSQDHGSPLPAINAARLFREPGAVEIAQQVGQDLFHCFAVSLRLAQRKKLHIRVVWGDPAFARSASGVYFHPDRHEREERA